MRNVGTFIKFINYIRNTSIFIDSFVFFLSVYAIVV